MVIVVVDSKEDLSNRFCLSGEEPRPDFIQPEIVKTQVLNQQVAPTIIKALGFNPNELQAVKAEQIQVLPFLFGSN